MKISVVTISFNQAHFLERAIRSVIEQDHDDIEYIVVDPGSTDGSREIIERYRDRIATVIFEPDDGPVDGLNKGFAVATGELCAYLNSDDALLPGALSTAVGVFRDHPETDVMTGHGYIIDTDGDVLRRFYSNRLTPWMFVHGGVSVLQQSTYFRRRAFDLVGGFNPENGIWWDGELILDMALKGCQFRVVNKFMSVFTVHEDSISGMRHQPTEQARKLQTLRDDNWQRLYQKVMGRGLDWRARPGMIVARLVKWLAQPRGTIWNGLAKLGVRSDRMNFKTIHRE